MRLKSSLFASISVSALLGAPVTAMAAPAAITPPPSAASVAFVAPGTSPVVQAVANRLNRQVFITDYGVPGTTTCDGVSSHASNDDTAFVNAQTAAYNLSQVSGGVAITIPSGAQCRTATGWTLSVSGVSLVGQPGASLKLADSVSGVPVLGITASNTGVDGGGHGRSGGGFVIDGDSGGSGNDTTTGVYVAASLSNVFVRGVTVQNVNGAGGAAAPGYIPGFGLLADTETNFVVRDNDFKTIQFAAALVDMYSGSAITTVPGLDFSNNFADQSADQPIYYGSAGFLIRGYALGHTYDHAAINNNAVLGVYNPVWQTAEGMEVRFTSNSTVSNNQFTNGSLALSLVANVGMSASANTASSPNVYAFEIAGTANSAISASSMDGGNLTPLPFVLDNSGGAAGPQYDAITGVDITNTFGMRASGYVLPETTSFTGVTAQVAAWTGSIGTYGSYSNVVLTVSACSVCGLHAGEYISTEANSDVTANTLIQWQLDGTAGGIGHYLVNRPQTIASETMTSNGVSVTAVGSGSMSPGSISSALQFTGPGEPFTGTGVAASTQLGYLVSGAGGAGSVYSYTNSSSSFSSETLTGTYGQLNITGDFYGTAPLPGCTSYDQSLHGSGATDPSPFLPYYELAGAVTGGSYLYHQESGTACVAGVYDVTVSQTIASSGSPASAVIGNQYGAITNLGVNARSTVIAGLTDSLTDQSFAGIYLQNNAGGQMQVLGGAITKNSAGQQCLYLVNSWNVAMTGVTCQGAVIGQIFGNTTETLDNIVLNGNVGNNAPTLLSGAVSGGAAYGTHIVTSGNSGFLCEYKDFGDNISICYGTGSPNSAVTAGIGSTYTQTNTTSGSTLWTKESGTSNTGWVQTMDVGYSLATPSLFSGFGTSPSIVAHTGSTIIHINVGTGGTASFGSVGFSTTVPTYWGCAVSNLTNATTEVTRIVGAGTTYINVANYSATTGLSIPWTASDVIALTGCGAD